MHTLQADSHIKHYSDQIKLHNPAASTPAAQKHVIITSFVHAMLAIFLILFEYDLREVLTRWVPAALGNVVSPFFGVFYLSSSICSLSEHSQTPCKPCSSWSVELLIIVHGYVVIK